ncbi:hypothetical protein TNCV_3071451 [Trichonephila clavipes]|nr:hypothetical protein TNCV_3071451 [Trichonephila clavipes]
MEDDSFRRSHQSTHPKRINPSFFFLNLILISLVVVKVFLTVLINNVWNIKKTNNGRSKIFLDIYGVYLQFWYENHLFEKSYQTSKELLMTVFDATKQEDIRKFHKLKLNDTKELISFFTEKLSLGKKLNYDDSSIVEHMTLSSPTHYQKFLSRRFRHPANGSQPCDLIATGQRRPKTGRYLYPMESRIR